MSSFVVSNWDAYKFYGVVKESIQLQVHFSLENGINVGLYPSHRPFYQPFVQCSCRQICGYDPYLSFFLIERRECVYQEVDEKL